VSSPALNTAVRFPTLAVVGVGLIGGSIASATRQRGIADRVIGIGRSRERLADAVRAGVIDALAADANESQAAAAEADLVIVCTPVDRIADDVLALAPALRAGSLITDAGSTKGAICRTVQCGLTGSIPFVGSHPLAGSEKGGWEHADASLFEGRVCVVTPLDDTPPEVLERVSAFWRALGMRVRHMSPDDHDRALAVTSHLPHLAAAALASLLTNGEAELAASGFRDTTRVAAGDPDLWTAIFLQNTEPVLDQASLLIEQLREFQRAIRQGDAGRIRQLLEEGREGRQRLDEAP
jgi:prephenate dehydrogenase